MAAAASATQRTQLVAGVAAVVAGFLVAGMIYFRPEGLRTPAWVGYVAALAFLFAGACALATALAVARLQRWLALGVVSCMLIVTSWIAFGPGARECTMTFSFSSGIAPDAWCRAAFGVGAFLIAAILVLVARGLASNSKGSE
jgi:hypothetical protein